MVDDQLWYPADDSGRYPTLSSIQTAEHHGITDTELIAVQRWAEGDDRAWTRDDLNKLAGPAPTGRLDGHQAPEPELDF
jgi:hypothetical protein